MPWLFDTEMYRYGEAGEELPLALKFVTATLTVATFWTSPAVDGVLYVIHKYPVNGVPMELDVRRHWNVKTCG